MIRLDSIAEDRLWVIVSPDPDCIDYSHGAESDKNPGGITEG